MTPAAPSPTRATAARHTGAHTPAQLDLEDTMTDTLPHDPYITAVTDALTAAGLEPDDWWTSDAETDPYETGPDAGCTTMLSAVLSWDGHHQAVGDDGPPHGLLLIWEHPAEQWQVAERRAEGGNEEPEFLPTLGLYSHPDAVVAMVRGLLSGEGRPEGHAPYWHPADAVRTAVAAWASDDS